MDLEWGVPVLGPKCDQRLFEMLSLEGAQAGLSWDTILRKREAYRRAFANFDIATVAKYDDKKMQALLNSPLQGDKAIVKNKLKVQSVVRNAQLCLAIIQEYGSLSKYLWSFVGGRPLVTRRADAKSIPNDTPEARLMAKALKKRGFTFVGPVCCYSFMQSTGMVNDHPVGTPQFTRAHKLALRHLKR